MNIDFIPINTLALMTGVALNNVKNFIIEKNIKTKFVGDVLYVDLVDFKINLVGKPLKDHILN